jgi:polyphosphate kinase 2 (PPK2 family)
VKAEDFIVCKRPRLGSITKHRKVEFADYERRLASMQSTVQAIQQAYLGTRERAVVVLEGWDTAGKGGVVRRLGWALDPRSFKVHPIAAPSAHERGKHYLQRFWEKLPEPGQIVVFDRSWYGRVLVERVEGFATKREWRRGYEEINQFERLLVADGIRITKIFLHISAGEQIRRFKDRVTNPLKRWKLSYEDFRNRERWADYEASSPHERSDMRDDVGRYLIPATLAHPCRGWVRLNTNRKIAPPQLDVAARETVKSATMRANSAGSKEAPASMPDRRFPRL